METDLLPLSLGDIFDEAFDLYKRNFSLFAGIVAVVQVPLQIAMQALTYALGLDRFGTSSAASPAEELYTFFGSLVVFFGFLLLYSFVYVVQTGALTVAISERYLGRPITLAGAYRATLGRLFKLLATWVLVVIMLIGIVYGAGIVIVLPFGLIVAATQLGGGGEVVAAALGILIVLVVGGIWLLGLTLMGAFVTQIVVVEGLGYWKAIQRNWQLVLGKLPRVFGGIVLMFFISFVLVVSLAGSVELAMSAFVYPWLHVSESVQGVVSSIWFSIIGMFMQPFWMVCMTLLYYDQRVRREGLDLTLLERQLHARAAAGGRA